MEHNLERIKNELMGRINNVTGIIAEHHARREANLELALIAIRWYLRTTNVGVEIATWQQVRQYILDEFHNQPNINNHGKCDEPHPECDGQSKVTPSGQ